MDPTYHVHKRESLKQSTPLPTPPSYSVKKKNSKKTWNKIVKRVIFLPASALCHARLAHNKANVLPDPVGLSSRQCWPRCNPRITWTAATSHKTNKLLIIISTTLVCPSHYVSMSTTTTTTHKKRKRNVRQKMKTV